jgi:hypothetical protein
LTKPLVQREIHGIASRREEEPQDEMERKVVTKEEVHFIVLDF